MKFKESPSSAKLKEGDIVVLGHELLSAARAGFVHPVDENTKFRVKEASRQVLRVEDVVHGEVIDICIYDLFPDREPSTLVKKVVLH